MTQNVCNNFGEGEEPTALLQYDPLSTTIISNSANISSVTYSALGKYIVNFNPVFTDANYVPICTIDSGVGAPGTPNTWQTAYIDSTTGNPTTAALHISAYGRTAAIVYAYSDDNIYNVAIFGI
ncbi:MAG: hypothetical protein ABIP54_02240 [Candidatus Andersenbacteria bacterium]